MNDVRQAVDHYFHRCIETEEPPRVSELAEILGVSRETLSREFASTYGMPLSTYLKQRQLAHAQSLLARSSLPVARIAILCGYGAERSFYRAFRRATGMSPDAYRRRHEMSLAS